jgi:hypothetical protein
VDVAVKDGKLTIEYKKPVVIDQFKPKKVDEKTSQ